MHVHHQLPAPVSKCFTLTFLIAHLPDHFHFSSYSVPHTILFSIFLSFPSSLCLSFFLLLFSIRMCSTFSFRLRFATWCCLSDLFFSFSCFSFVSLVGSVPPRSALSSSFCPFFVCSFSASCCLAFSMSFFSSLELLPTDRLKGILPILKRLVSADSRVIRIRRFLESE